MATPTITTTYALTVMARQRLPLDQHRHRHRHGQRGPRRCPPSRRRCRCRWAPRARRRACASHPGATWTWTLSGGVITAGQTTRQIVFDAALSGHDDGLHRLRDQRRLLVARVLDQHPGRLPRRAARQHLPLVRRRRRAQRRHRRLRRRQLLRPAPRSRARRWPSSCSRPSTARASCPPSCTGLFTDVACPGGFAVDWIEQLSLEGITGGCGGTNYCPNNPVRARPDGRVPPEGAPGLELRPAARHRHDLHRRPRQRLRRGLDRGSLLARRHRRLPDQSAALLPGNTNNRQQMAVFITKTFGLPVDRVPPAGSIRVNAELNAGSRQRCLDVAYCCGSAFAGRLITKTFGLQ